MVGGVLSGAPPASCGVCGRTFASEKGLRIHTGKMHKEPKGSKGGLVHHQTRDHGDMRSEVQKELKIEWVQPDIQIVV